MSNGFSFRFVAVISFALLYSALISSCGGQEQELSEEAQYVINQPTPTPRATIAQSTFEVVMAETCLATINWWNSDPQDEGDIPSGGKEACTLKMVERWCQDGHCKWPGQAIGIGGYSFAHEAAELSWTAMAALPNGPKYLGNRFVGKFKEELVIQREALEIAP